MSLENIVSAALVGGSAGLAGIVFAIQPSIPRPDVTPASQFQPADFHVYDRNFPHEQGTCELGIADKKICFSHSLLEDTFVRGQTLPAHLTATSVEFPVIVRTPLKEHGLRTVRFGHTVALYDPGTRTFVDVMDLDQKTFEQAIRTGSAETQIAATETSALR